VQTNKRSLCMLHMIHIIQQCFNGLETLKPEIFASEFRKKLKSIYERNHPRTETKKLAALLFPFGKKMAKSRLTTAAGDDKRDPPAASASSASNSNSTPTTSASSGGTSNNAGGSNNQRRPQPKRSPNTVMWLTMIFVSLSSAYKLFSSCVVYKNGSFEIVCPQGIVLRGKHV
jgi:hypothetical protein